MQARLPATETSTRPSGLSRWPTIAGLSLAIGLTAVVGLAQIRDDGAVRTTERTAVSEAPPALPAQGAALGGTPRHVVYIAATEEQAAHALRFSAEINTLRAELGQPLVSVGALVVRPDSTLARDGLPGTPGTRYFDLRTP
jgi:hypothetical protein